MERYNSGLVNGGQSDTFHCGPAVSLEGDKTKYDISDTIKYGSPCSTTSSSRPLKGCQENICHRDERADNGMI